MALGKYTNVSFYEKTSHSFRTFDPNLKIRSTKAILLVFRYRGMYSFQFDFSLFFGDFYHGVIEDSTSTDGISQTDLTILISGV